MNKFFWKIIIIGFSACVSCTLLWASPSIQNKKVTLNCRNRPLRMVLEAISKQTDAKFVYEDKLVDGKTVSCRFANTPFDEALKQITDQSEISFRFQSMCLVQHLIYLCIFFHIAHQFYPHNYRKNP